LEEVGRCIQCTWLTGAVALIPFGNPDYDSFATTCEQYAIGIVDELSPLTIVYGLPASAIEPANHPTLLREIAEEIAAPTDSDKVEFQSLTGVFVRWHFERIGSPYVAWLVEIPVSDLKSICRVQCNAETVRPKSPSPGTGNQAVAALTAATFSEPLSSLVQ
jgi:hypothetical protein